jgi:ectoine hydroxylase-related dioxygenase (phytanoyl-CoA dioxygenase family)
VTSVALPYCDCTQRRRAFEAQGWLVVRGVFSAARVAELTAALDAVVPEQAYAHGFAGQVVEVPSISLGSAVLREAALDRRVAALAAELLGAERVRLLQDTAFIKPAAVGGPVQWHQDLSYFSFLQRPAALTARVALTPCTAENGCLRVLSGSQAWGLQRDYTFRATTVEDALAEVPPALRAGASESLVELQPGDVSFHHCLTFHSSGPNPAGAPRKTLAMRLVDAVVPAVLARLDTPQARVRVPCDAEGRLSDEVFPLCREATG